MLWRFIIVICGLIGIYSILNNYPGLSETIFVINNMNFTYGGMLFGLFIGAGVKMLKDEK